MKLRQATSIFGRLADEDSVEVNGRTMLKHSTISISTDGRRTAQEVPPELSGSFHAITGANGWFRTEGIADLNAEEINVDSIRVLYRIGHHCLSGAGGCSPYPQVSIHD